ncbi:MAG: hypothetical protein JW762_12795 [Dehalococcoidales bacterium]|nr:hypothetical protein [Dehalococcoidales bacterium]
MKSKLRTKTIIAMCILIIPAVLSFVLTNALINNGSASADDGKYFSSVETLEEASRLVGYHVSTPSFVPDDFKNPPSITVFDSGANLPMRVMQIWSSADDIYFLLIQDPSLDGIGGGTSAEVCDMLGEKQFLEANNNRPGILSLYWRNEDMAYSIAGTLRGILDEVVLEKIASSVMINK